MISSPYARRLIKRTSDPATGYEGQLYLNTTTNTVRLYQDGAWGNAAGTGDVIGAASSTDNAVTRYDGTTGKLVQNSTAFVDDNGNVIASNIAPGFATTVSAAALTTLTVASAGVQELTGSTTQIFKLPVVSTLPQTGFSFFFINNSSGAITLKSSGNFNFPQTLVANSRAIVTCIALTGTGSGSWTVTYISTGITNSAPSGTVPKSNGTNLEASQITDDGDVVDIGNPAATYFEANQSSNTIEMVTLGNAVINAGANSFTLSSPANDDHAAIIAALITATASTESLAIDGAAHTATLTAATAINLDSKGGVTTIGDVNNVADNVFLEINNPGQSIEFGPGVASFYAQTAGRSNGDVTHPWGSVFIGESANNSSQITGAFTDNRVATFPDASGTVLLDQATQLHAYTFAGLPTGVAGMIAYVTDSNTVTWGATIAGGSTNKVLAFFNGTNWTVMAH